MAATRPARLRRRTAVMTAAVMVCVASAAGIAQAAPPASPQPTGTDIASDESADMPAPEPASARAKRLRRTTTCDRPAEGRFQCLTVSPAPRPAAARSTGGASATALPPVPAWCDRDLDARRTEGCELVFLRRQLFDIRDRVVVLTGEMDLQVTNYVRTSNRTGVWTHWLEIFAYAAWGSALGGTVVQAERSHNGHCIVRSQSFPLQDLLPLGRRASGQATYVTTTTQRGGIGTCVTNWFVRTTTPGYPPSNPVFITMTDIRCDFATGGTDTIGCVVPWYPSAVVYSQLRYPTLATHVIGAQVSGLPGATLADPLIRTTNPAIITFNRFKACGDAPSIPNFSCDEYPPATSRQGLSAGGTRRTQVGCSFPALPPDAEGPSGASVCMIIAAENSAQGGLHTQFFRRERVLDGDPFRVLVGP